VFRSRIRGFVLARRAASCTRCGRAVALAGPPPARFSGTPLTGRGIALVPSRRRGKRDRAPAGARRSAATQEQPRGRARGCGCV